MPERISGVLLHVSSLPSLWGKGDFGPDAYHFIDWLEKTGQSLWQLLPLTYPDHTGSPYASPSANAINPAFISPDMLRKAELLSDADWDICIQARETGTHDVRRQAFVLAYQNWKQYPRKEEFETFCNVHAYWLHNTALFMTLQDIYQGTWYDFPVGLRNRDTNALIQWEEEHADVILQFKFEQYILFNQWAEIKTYANTKGIRIIGDIPIFISGNSADVWMHRNLFKLDENGFPLVWTGVPPDLFTKTGQLWGQPHFDWEAMKADNYTWWIQRVIMGKIHADVIRIDHFRGFCAAYEIPYGAPTAETGTWVKGPQDDIFRAFNKQIPGLSVIAEDLGIITADVTALRQQFNYPGMKILQFAFNSDTKNAYLPENYENSDHFVVYSGTHDNNTSRGWYEHASDPEKKMLARYAECNASNAAWTLIEMAFYSNAMWVVVPMQDILNLDAGARMNTPGTVENNWIWQLDVFEPSELLTQNLKMLTKKSGRSRL